MQVRITNNQIKKSVFIIPLLLLSSEFQLYSNVKFDTISHNTQIQLYYKDSLRTEPDRDFFRIDHHISAGLVVIVLTDENTKIYGNFEIYSITGKLVLNGLITTEETAVRVGNLSRGIYLAYVSVNKKQGTKKFIIK